VITVLLELKNDLKQEIAGLKKEVREIRMEEENGRSGE